MQHAIDISGKKITPAYSGEKAVCGFCKKEVIGKCGEIYIWHWQHVHSADCDLWKEGETEWHRAWKNKFPIDWQETIIEKNGEKHIADIFTPNGIVIEFQNSTISSSTIAEREKFYEKMIWVINAQTFKDNLITENKSREQLAQIELRYLTERSLLSKHNSFGLQNIKKKQTALTSEIQSRKDDLRALESVTTIFDSFNKNAETFAEQIIITWQSENLFVDPLLIQIISDDAIPTKKIFFRLLGDLKRNKHFLRAAVENSVEIEELYKQCNDILNELENLKPALKEELKSVASQYLNLEVEIAQLKREISFLELGNAENDREYQDLKTSIDEYIKTNLEKLEADFDEERNKIIQDKDKLTLSWKRERKSWASAAAPIFLDIGDGNLLYKHSGNKVSRVKVCDFIKKYNPEKS